VEGPLAVYAPWVGVYGIGAVAACIAALIALAFRRARGQPFAVAAGLALVLLCVPALIGAARGTPAGDAARSHGSLRLALLQGNIPQDEKFVPGGGVATALKWYGEQLRHATASLVITPETALPLLPSQLPPGYLQAIALHYASGSQAAIVGLPLGDGGDYSNSVIGLRPGAAQPYRYDKHHLVPFGEFIPRLFRWFTEMMNIPLGDFRGGGLAQAPFMWQGQRIAPNICYEDLFGDEIGANFRIEAEAPTILLNVSNIAWFGDSVAIDQHLAISRMRALEFRRPMVRATNTGATVVIDHRGRVTHELPRLTRGVLEAEVEGRVGLTPYAVWVSRFGLWPLWGLALAVVAITLASRRRRPA
jgi:apolipoprotein N-acyltransferase